jgi:hypothetical protein
MHNKDLFWGKNLITSENDVDGRVIMLLQYFFIKMGYALSLGQ